MAKTFTAKTFMAKTVLIPMLVWGLVMAAFPAGSTIAAAPTQNLGAFTLVPIDERPFTLYTAQKIAELGGYKANTPDKSLLGHYFTPGDPEAVGNWFVSDAQQTLASVVAVPMLAYGGLINSRYHHNLTLAEAQNNLQVIKTVKQQNPNKKIYAFDVIMRLTISPTGTYPGTYAGEIRKWAILKDKVENLGMTEFADEYNAVSSGIPQELKDDYLAARARNFAINNMIIDWVADGTIDFLILGQDDAEPYGLHRPERIALQNKIDALGLNDKIKVYPGADVVSSLLVTKLMMEQYGANPKVYVEYSRVHGDNWIAPYQDIPYSQVIGNYVDTLGGSMAATPEQADIVLMANTAGTASISAFADNLQRYLDKGYYVAVGDDARAGVSDKVLINELSSRIKLGDLTSYSGWNIGVSITQAFARWALLQSVQTGKLELLRQAAESQIELLLAAFTHEDKYRNSVRNNTKAYAESLGQDSQQILNYFTQINNYAVNNTKPLGDQVYRSDFHLRTIHLGNDGTGKKYGVVRSLDDWDMYLPWNRTAEMACFPEVSVALSPNLALSSEGAIATADSHYSNYTPDKAIDGIVSSISSRWVSGDSSSDHWLQIAFPQATTFDTVRITGYQGFVLVDYKVQAHIGGNWVDIVSVTGNTSIKREHSFSAVNADKIRLYVTNGTDARARVSEFEVFKTKINYALQSEGAAATASSHFNNYTASKANDGNWTGIASRWISADGPSHWLRIDFSGAKTINTVKVIGYDGFPLVDYQIDVLSGGNWVNVAAVTGNSAATRVHAFAPVSATAIRIVVTDGTDSKARIYELEAYDL